MSANDPPDDDEKTSPVPNYDEETRELIMNVETESHPLPDIDVDALRDIDTSDIPDSELTVAGYVDDDEARRRGEFMLEQIRRLNDGELPEGYQEMAEGGVFDPNDPATFYRNVMTPQITRRQAWFEQEMSRQGREGEPFRPPETEQ